MKPLNAALRSRTARWLCCSIAVVVTIASLTSWWAWSQATHVPEFYKRARNQSGAVGEIARSALKFDVERARKDAAKNRSWRASFSEEEINAWLQAELPERFDRLFAHGVSEPAIAIENGELLAAARYTSRRWDMVVSCRLTVEMTEEPNLLAIALSDLKAGALPLPVDPFIRRISKEAAMGDLDIRWDFTDKGPIALVTIPQDDDQYVLRPLVIEVVHLVAGQLQLAGRSGEQASNDYEPRGRVHRFVSYRQKKQSQQR